MIELGRFPGMVLAVKKDKAAQVKSFKDLKGMKVGVTAPGSSTNFFVNALIGKEGLKPTDVSIIGVGGGAGAVAAMKKGELDALVNLDPVISKLEQDGDIVILADSRTEEGNMKLFGGNNPGGSRLSEDRLHREESRDRAARRQRLPQGAEVAGKGDPGAGRRNGAAGISARATRRSTCGRCRPRGRCTPRTASSQPPA